MDMYLIIGIAVGIFIVAIAVSLMMAFNKVKKIKRLSERITDTKKDLEELKKGIKEVKDEKRTEGFSGDGGGNQLPSLSEQHKLSYAQYIRTGISGAEQAEPREIPIQIRDVSLLPADDPRKHKKRIKLT